MSSNPRCLLLGPVGVLRGATDVPLGPRHQRLLLALLIARAGGLVETYEIVRLLWQGDPPPTGTNMIHRYVSNLRRILEPESASRASGRWLVSESGGYRLLLDPHTSDLLQFRALVERAGVAAGAGDNAAALRQLIAGLELWRGRCAAGLGEAADSYPLFVAVEGEYLTAARRAGEAALADGAVAQVLPFLREAVVRSPLDEALQAVLLRVLAADGKQAEAVARFGELRARLADELGVGPGPELQAAFQDLLRHSGGTPMPTAESPQSPPQRSTMPPPATAATLAVRPAQLPADPRHFTGRSEQLAAGSAHLGSRPAGVPIVAFDGMAGVGKTTLAVRLAHRAVPHFPDGQLYADLHGFDSGRRADPADVLDDFLFALGVERSGIPEHLEARAALYRSALAGRRMLVVLDNAWSTEQIKPLLPGASGNGVIVTSRHRLTTLSAVHGAQLHTVDLLERSQARAGFVQRIGAARAEAEPRALDEIIDRCGRLPLALAVVAARLLMDADRSLESMAAELRRSRGTLDAFTTEEAADVDIRAVLSWSHRLLSAGAAAMLRRLALQTAAEYTLDTAAAAAGVPTAEARALLRDLTRCRLLIRRGPDRYWLHELVRAYAMESGGLAMGRLIQPLPSLRRV